MESEGHRTYVLRRVTLADNTDCATARTVSKRHRQREQRPLQGSREGTTHQKESERCQPACWLGTATHNTFFCARVTTSPGAAAPQHRAISSASSAELREGGTKVVSSIHGGICVPPSQTTPQLAQ